MCLPFECEIINIFLYQNNVGQAMATAIENTHGVHDWVAGTACDILCRFSDFRSSLSPSIGLYTLPVLFNCRVISKYK